MSERDQEHFDIEEEFLNEVEEEPDLDKFLDRVNPRVKPGKKGKAAWSKLEDALAERRLARELQDLYDEDDQR